MPETEDPTTLRGWLAFDIRETDLVIATRAGRPGRLRILLEELESGKPAIVPGKILAQGFLRMQDKHNRVRVQRVPLDRNFVLQPDDTYVVI